MSRLTGLGGRRHQPQPAAAIGGWQTCPGRVQARKSRRTAARSAARALPRASSFPAEDCIRTHLAHPGATRGGGSGSQGGTDLWDRCAGAVSPGNCPGSALARVCRGAQPRDRMRAWHCCVCYCLANSSRLTGLGGCAVNNAAATAGGGDRGLADTPRQGAGPKIPPHCRAIAPPSPPSCHHVPSDQSLPGLFGAVFGSQGGRAGVSLERTSRIAGSYLDDCSLRPARRYTALWRARVP